MPFLPTEKQRFQLKIGDILLNEGQSIELVGRSAIYRGEPKDCCFQNTLVRFRAGPRACPEFIQFVFQSYLRTGIFASIALQTTSIAHLGAGRLAKLKVPFPTKAEQEAIAEVLSDADALIESLEQLLVKKHQIKQGAMQELLTGKRRLAGFSRQWKVVTLGEIGKCLRGVSYNPDRDLSQSESIATIRLLRSNNVQAGSITFSDMQFVDSGRVSPAQYLRRHDILICMANGSRDLVGKAGYFMESDGFSYTFGAFMGCFRPNSQVTDPNFAFYLFHTSEYRAHVAVLLAGSSINNLTPTSVEGFSIQVPVEIAEQSAIATVLTDMDAEITALEAKLTKARQIKQGMMQELLTGRIRLV